MYHGLLPKTRPAFDSHNPQLHRSWKQNRQHFGRQQLNLLIQECKIKIKDLQRREVKFKNKLKSCCNSSTTYVSLTSKLSNHISNTHALRQTFTQNKLQQSTHNTDCTSITHLPTSLQICGILCQLMSSSQKP